MLIDYDQIPLLFAKVFFMLVSFFIRKIQSFKLGKNGGEKC